MNNRRKLAIALGAGALAAPFGLFAQPQAAKIARLGILSPLTATIAAHNLEALREGLRDLGWVEGRNLVIENRFGEGRADRLPELANELVRLKVDVIVTGAFPGALAAKNATTTIPIVMVTTGDPVASGLIGSLARPGGNVTGVTALGRELSVKRLSLLKETVAGVARVAVLSNPANPEDGPMVKSLEVAARSLGLQLRVIDVRDPTEFENAFATITKERAGAIMVLTDSMFYTHSRRIVELAAKSRLPTTYGVRQYVDDGGLMFYGATLADMYYRAATYVDKILKGAKPADLPVEQPTKFDFVVNMKTAKALGIKIPNSILVQATKIIE
jgi:putative ABC transport system substrate-binding protein